MPLLTATSEQCYPQCLRTFSKLIKLNQKQGITDIVKNENYT